MKNTQRILSVERDFNISLTLPPLPRQLFMRQRAPPLPIAKAEHISRRRVSRFRHLEEPLKSISTTLKPSLFGR